MNKLIKLSIYIVLSPLIFIFPLNIIGLLPEHQLVSFLYAGLIAVINFSLYLIFFSLALNKPNNQFLIFTMGGIGARLFLMLILVLITLKFLKVDETGFIFALFVWYILTMVMEILIVRDRLGNQKQNKID